MNTINILCPWCGVIVELPKAHEHKAVTHVTMFAACDHCRKQFACILINGGSRAYVVALDSQKMRFASVFDQFTCMLDDLWRLIGGMSENYLSSREVPVPAPTAETQMSADECCYGEEEGCQDLPYYASFHCPACGDLHFMPMVDPLPGYVDVPPNAKACCKKCREPMPLHWYRVGSTLLYKPMPICDAGREQLRAGLISGFEVAIFHAAMETIDTAEQITEL